MKDCIIHCFKNVQNQTVELNQLDNVDETDYFSFYIDSSIELTNVTVLLTDIPLKIIKTAEIDNRFLYCLDYDSVKTYFESQGFDKVSFYFKEFELKNLGQKSWFYKLFVNYPVGLCEIVLFDNNKLESLNTFKLNIVSSKIDEFEFSSLVSYVEEKGTSIWAKYSLLKHTAEKFEASDKMEWLLSFCEFFTKEFEENYLHFFGFDKIKIIQQKNEIASYSSDINISEDSLFWLVNNLDVIQPTVFHDVNKVLINNRIFAPLEILSAELKESTDTNENQIVHGFISELIRFLTNTKALFETKLKKCSRIKFEELIQYYSYVRSLDRLKRILTKLFEIKYYLEEHIPVTNETLEFLNTNKIESKEHYNYLYRTLIEWLLYKDATFSKDNKLFRGINRMDQLFERACFYKLIDSFERLGYDSINVDFDVNRFPNKVRLTKKGVVHYLYSQIIPNKLTTVKKGRGLQPDFFIELESEKYIILDAKYKKIWNVKEYDYPELVLKYLHGIGYKSGGYFNPLALFVLYPDKTKKINFYQKDEFDLYGEKPVFPSIGSVSLNFQEESILLNNTIKKLLEIN